MNQFKNTKIHAGAKPEITTKEKEDMESENSGTPCSLRSDDSFGSRRSLEIGVEMTQRRRRIQMERLKDDGDRDDIHRFGSTLSLESVFEMTQRPRRIRMERLKADGDRDDSDSFGSQLSLERGFEMVQRRRQIRMEGHKGDISDDTWSEASQEIADWDQQGPSSSPHFTSAAAETSKEAEVSRDLSQGSNPKPAEDSTGTDAKVDVKPKPQDMSGSTQDPTSEPVNGKQSSKLPNRKPLPARKSRACSVM